MSRRIKVKRRSEPQPHDDRAALSDLSLTFEPPAASRWVEHPERAGRSEVAAKAILPASGRSLLGVGNSDGPKERTGIVLPETPSPRLPVADGSTGKVVIADGYHRLRAVHRFDEDAMSPCKIV